MIRKRAVFLDRDGVLIREKGYLFKDKDVELIPDVPKSLNFLSRLGLMLVIITNQSGIGRGLFSDEDHERVRQKILSLLDENGASIDGYYFCPHAPRENCDCRKPKPGLALRAAGDFGIDLSSSFVIGDKKTDLELARNIGAKGILVRTGYGLRTEKEEKPVWDAVVDSINEAAGVISKWIEGDKDGF